MDKQANTYMTRWYNHKHNYTVNMHTNVYIYIYTYTHIYYIYIYLYLYVYVCMTLFAWMQIQMIQTLKGSGIYNDLTGTSLQWSVIRVTILNCPYFRLVVSQWFLHIHTPYHTCCTAHTHYTVSFCTLDDVRAHTCQVQICTYIDTWMKEKHTD